MNILFFSMVNIISIDEHSMYSDLMKEFVNHGHNVTVINPIEKRHWGKIKTQDSECFKVINVNVGNITNTPFIEKGISVVRVNSALISAIKYHVGEKNIDLCIVAVPPVTFAKTMEYIKIKYGAKLYLLLKDIWPASIFDMSVPGGKFVKKLVCSFFRLYEKRLYKLSDAIGCISPKNVEYIIKNNAYISPEKVHVNPNSISPKDILPLSATEKCAIRIKYGVPTDKICFVYGGTLGVGQNVAHIVECMKACEDVDCHFVISGRGVQYHLLKEYVTKEKPKHITLINGLPKPEYEKLMQSCDIGLVFLRYTAQTANMPSRILSYMEYSIPVLACTDPVSDLGKILEDNHCGWYCLSNDAEAFRNMVNNVIAADLDDTSKMSRECLEREFTTENSYNIIINAIEEIMCK